MSWTWPAGPGQPGGGGGPAPVATLQPLNYAADLFAAYAFNEPDAACNVDRSGHGRDFSLAKGDWLASEMANVPDLVPGKGAIIPAGTTLYSTAPRKCTQHDAAWQAFVENAAGYTIAGRFWNASPSGLPAVVPFHIVPDLPASLGVIFYVETTGTLKYYCEANKAGQAFDSGITVTPNRWTFITCRVHPSGVVTLGVGKGPKPSQQTYATSGALARSSQGGATANWAARFCQYEVDGPDGGGGPIADWVFWNRPLTDAELVPQYGAAMVNADAGY